MKWEIFCLLVCSFGLAIRAFVSGYVPEGTSGRNTCEQKASSLNTKGLYSIVRHPLYLGNFFIWLGISLFVRHWWTTMLCLFFFLFYYERIIFAEEEFLRRKFGKAFETWANETPCFIPDFGKWKPSPHPFAWKKLLKDEYSGFFAIIFLFVILELVEGWVVLGRLELAGEWRYLLVVGCLTYVSLRLLKKKGLLEPSIIEPRRGRHCE